MHKKIIGLVGPICSGKGTTSKYLTEKYKATPLRFSTTLRAILDILYLPHTRYNTQKMFITLEKEFGSTILSNVMSNIIKKLDSNLVVIDGIRRPEDIYYLTQQKGFFLIGINASLEKRFERLKKRKENLDDKSKTWNQFLQDHKMPTETQIEYLISKSTHKIDNNGSIKELYNQLDELINSISKTET